jgi:hypothetical protein
MLVEVKGKGCVHIVMGVHTVIVLKEDNKISDDVYYVNRKGLLARRNPAKGECPWMDEAYWRYKSEVIALAESLASGDSFEWIPSKEEYTHKSDVKKPVEEPVVVEVTADEAAILDFDIGL